MQDPQSLHKYAYVHGDPIQGVDPTGLFLGVGSMIGALFSSAIGIFNDSQDAAASLPHINTASNLANYIHKFQKLYRLFEHAHDYYELANTVWSILEFDWNELAELKQKAIRLWGAIQSELQASTSDSSSDSASTRTASSTFGSVGTRSGRFFVMQLGIPLTKQAKVEKIRSIARAADKLPLISELIGETIAGRVARELGFMKADVTMQGRHGIDQLRRHGTLGTWMALEAKGGRSRLGTSSYGPQMSGRWIDHGLNQVWIRSRSTTDGAALGDAITRERRVLASISRFHVLRKGFQISLVSAIHKIGRDEAHLRDWPRGT